jgi:hypothetical protein
MTTDSTASFTSNRARAMTTDSTVDQGSSGGGGSKQIKKVMSEIQGLRNEFNEVRQSVADINLAMNKMMKMMGTTPQLTV